MFLKKAVKNTVRGMTGTMMDVTGGVKEGLFEAVQDAGSNVVRIGSDTRTLLKDTGRNVKLRLEHTDKRLFAGFALGAMALLAIGYLLREKKNRADKAQP